VESPGGGQSIIYRANDKSEPKEIGVFLLIKSVLISPRGTWLFLTEKETGESFLFHTQTSKQVYVGSSPIKAIAWSWDEEVFVCADSALKLSISDETGKTISEMDIDWQGFQPNMFHGLLK
jgi:WD40 repeat protein